MAKLLFLLLSLAGLGLMGAWYVLRTTPLLVGFLLVLAGFLAVFLMGFRCPHCGEKLGREVGSTCPHCGGKL